MKRRLGSVSVTCMELKSAAGLVIVFVAVFFAAILSAPLWRQSKDFQTISSADSVEMNSLSAEEINRRTLRLAHTIRPAD